MVSEVLDRYRQLTRDGMRWQVDEEFVHTDTFKTLVQNAANLQPPDSQGAKRRRGHLSWLLTADDENASLFVKKYYPRNPVNRFQYSFKPNRATNEFNANLRFQQLGLPTPRLLAWGERRRYNLWVNSLLIFEGFSEGITLKEIDWAGRDIDSLIDSMSRTIGRLHNSNIYFGDLHGGNLLVIPNGSEHRWLFTDLDKVRFKTSLSEHLCVDDLARLNAHVDASVAQRMSFLRKYCRMRRLREVKRWYALVNQRSEYLWRKYQKKHGIDVRKYAM